jgi:hypothetical protein
VANQQATSRRKVPKAAGPAPAETAKARVNPAATRQLREVDKQLERLHRQQEKLNEALVASRDHVELSKLGRELGVVRIALAKAEEQWLKLAEAAESTR